MGTRRRAVLVFVSLLASMALFDLAPVATAEDDEKKLLAKIEREQNPVKKAKLEIRLGRLKLLEAFAAFEGGDVELSHQTLEIYLKWMDGAWTALEGSGRQASRKPQGFKELDIALREDQRLLEDFEHRVPYQAREPVEKISKRVEELRELVLKELFPPQPLLQKGKEPPKAKQSLLWGKGYGA